MISSRSKPEQSIKYLRPRERSLLYLETLTVMTIATLEKTNMFHNVFKVWIKCGNTVEKLWKSSSTVLSIFHDMEFKLNVELLW